MLFMILLLALTAAEAHAAYTKNAVAFVSEEYDCDCR